MSRKNPQKQGKNVAVKLHGGPLDGDQVLYDVPLPKTLVVPYRNDNKTEFVDYQRRDYDSRDYDWVNKRG